jgi:polysaccharide pyruvyl transferase WcaK-like protein
MLLVLHGARRNAGDFLIRDRGLRLIARARPDAEIRLHERWLAVDPDLAAEARAIVLCGGPALAPELYPVVYPLVPRLDDLETPVLLLALGWCGEPAGHPERFAFTDRSRTALHQLAARGAWASGRDDISTSLLTAAGLDAQRSGCTAWYALDEIGQPFRPPATVRRVVVTTPARFGNGRQAVAVLRAVAARFPDAELVCAFHRGLDRHDTPLHHWGLNRLLARRAASLGYRVADLAGDATGLDLYRDVDLHVGYRVHAHLCTLSHRRPSLLVAEDGRGEGQQASLGDPHRLRASEPDLGARLLAAIDHEAGSAWPATAAAVDEIERTFPVMERTLDRLPR